MARHFCTPRKKGTAFWQEGIADGYLQVGDRGCLCLQASTLRGAVRQRTPMTAETIKPFMRCKQMKHILDSNLNSPLFAVPVSPAQAARSN